MAYSKKQTHIYIHVYVAKIKVKGTWKHTEKVGAVPPGHFTLTEKHKHSVFVKETKDRCLLSCNSIFYVTFFGISLPLELSG